MSGTPAHPRATTARTLLWAAGLLAVVGATIGSPAGGGLVLALAFLLAAPALLVRGRTRWFGAAVALVALGLAVARLPEARGELDRYSARARGANHGASEVPR